MTEISAVTAARAAVIRNENEALRERNLQARQRLDSDLQNAITRSELDVRQIDARRDAREETRRTDVRVDDENRRFFEDQEQTRATQLRDQARVETLRAIELEVFRADELNERFEEPPLTERLPVGSERTPEELALLRDQLTAPPAPEPPAAAPLPTDDRPRPEILGPRPDPDAPTGVFVAAGPPPAADPPAPPEADRFQALERDRESRVISQRRDDNAAAVRQEAELDRAARRIANAAQDPGVPRGSVVDVFG